MTTGMVTNKQWKKLLEKGRGLGLTNEMRGFIDWQLQGLIGFQELDEDEDGLIPRDLKKKLRALANQAERLAKELELPQVGLAILAAEASTPGDYSPLTAELVGDPRPMRGRSASQPKKVSQPITFFAFTKYLSQLPERLQRAADEVQPGKRHDAVHRRGFLALLDARLFQHTMSQSDKWYEFVSAVYQIAGCRVGEESIKKDIEEAQKMRPTSV